MLVAGFIVATLPPSVVDAAEPNVVSFNLCVFNDSRCNEPGYAANGTMKAVYFQNAMAAEGPYPLVITLQEACFASSYTAMKTFANVYGYRIQFRQTNTSCGSQYGEIVLWKGGCFGSTNPNVDQNAGCVSSGNYSQTDSGHVRGYVCGRSGLPDFIACSTHAVPDNPTKSLSNNSEYYSVAVFLGTVGGYRPVFAAGDFNITPWQTAPGMSALASTTFYANGWREADQHAGSIDRSTSDSHGKLDYIFAAFRCTTQDAGIAPSTTPITTSSVGGIQPVSSDRPIPVEQPDRLDRDCGPFRDGG